MSEDGLLRVQKDDRTCIWIPALSKDGVPMEGKGIYIGESKHESARQGDVALLCGGKDFNTGWFGIRQRDIQKVALAMMTRSREMKDG